MKSLQFGLLAVFLMLIGSGCLTSPNAFYTPEHVFQDDRIVGEGRSGRFVPSHRSGEPQEVRTFWEGGTTARCVQAVCPGNTMSAVKDHGSWEGIPCAQNRHFAV